MISADVLAHGFDQVEGALRGSVEGLADDQLTARVEEGANTLAWLAWHLTRVQDDHVSEVAGTEQVWTADGWAERLALPFAAEEVGYGFTSEQVGAVSAPADQLLAYHAAVHTRTAAFLAGLSDDDLERVVDDSYDPPVTLGVRLVSVLSDDLQHAGQAAFVRGVLQRR